MRALFHISFFMFIYLQYRSLITYKTLHYISEVIIQVQFVLNQLKALRKYRKDNKDQLYSTCMKYDKQKPDILLK